MTLKDLKTIVRQQDTPAGHAVLAALLAAQKREREVFKRLSEICDARGTHRYCWHKKSTTAECSMCNCPALKEIK